MSEFFHQFLIWMHQQPALQRRTISGDVTTTEVRFDMKSEDPSASPTPNQLQWVRMLGPLRRILGWLCLAVAALGAIMPIIPGWPALIFAIVLLGRRDPLLRRINLIARGTLRLLRNSPVPWLRTIGGKISAFYVRMRTAVMPHITSAERHLGDPAN